MKTLAFILLILSPAIGWAQYHVNGCKSPKLRGEICIIKNSPKSDKFSSSDLLLLKNYIASHPGLPWAQVIDPNKKLLRKLKAGAAKIRKPVQARYNDLLDRLKIRLEPEYAVEAISLYVAAHPSYSFHLNSKDRFLMRRFVNVLSAGAEDNIEISRYNYWHCSPNLKKFKAIMKERSRCSNLEESRNSFNLYHTLAELAACDKYAVEHIDAKESKTSDEAREETPEEAPCIVKLRDISASVGRGAVEIKSDGKVYRLDLSAGHDLSGIKNDISYWRDQLEPQFIKAIEKPAVANSVPALPED